ncbi:hypothetical protein ABZ725_42045 [Streptomyces sp. NPDC006872]|uniref:hypothetical protein n=1 Tax=Streptomyces sp. NPDC006872 TaxID=3155720 RepID=UPI0033F8BE3D
MEISYAIASGLFDEWDLGTVPAWVGSILTGGSLLFAAITFSRSRGDEKRAQASKVGAWVSQEDDDEPASFKYILNVSNTSDVGAYEIVVTDPESGELLAVIEKLEPKKAERIEMVRDKNSWKKRTTGMHLIRSSAGKVDRVKLRMRDTPVVLELRDALGRRWRIDPNRKITKVRHGMAFKKVHPFIDHHIPVRGEKRSPSAAQESNDNT